MVKLLSMTERPWLMSAASMELADPSWICHDVCFVAKGRLLVILDGSYKVGD